MSLKDRRILVLGGSSGIGLGVAKAAQDEGAQVTIASRSKDKVDAAIRRLGGKADGLTLDTADAEALERHFADNEPYDHVFCSASSTRNKPVRELPLEDAYASFNSKFWGAYRLARAARIKDGGSLTFTSGFLSVRPKKGATLQSAINAALEALTRGLALEFAPVRVNCVSPGLVQTEMYDTLEGDGRKAMFEGAAETLPAGLVGQPEHIAIQVMAFMQNPYMTGSTVYVEGGGLIA